MTTASAGESGGAAKQIPIVSVNGSEHHSESDSVAAEEPLEIRVAAGGAEPVSVAITMRTPGHDNELEAGFLWGEGLLGGDTRIVSVQPGGAIQPGGYRNVVVVTLAGALPDLSASARHFYMTSSCGVCGKASLEAIGDRKPFDLSRAAPRFVPAAVYALPAKLRAAQETFARTGGLHAAALFDAGGNLLLLREDVGRHNAVDKLVGAAVLSGSLPLSGALLLLSGRASFELVQKAVMAGIPLVAAVGAPSSLAVSLAKDNGVTLLGFVRGERFNIYAGEERIERG